MMIDGLRIVGSAQTNVVMDAELTRICHRALHRRPGKPAREGSGQLVYPWDPEIATTALAYHRTATRILRDLYASSARRLEPMYEELLAAVVADDRGVFRNRATFSIEARRVTDFAAGERQVVGTVKNAIIDGMARRGIELDVNADAPDVHLVVRLDDANRIVVSHDLGGGSLSQRGWRRDSGEAPLREHLAAVLLMLGRFDPRRDILVDPMCGSGTIPIEAVLMAHGRARRPEDGVDLFPGGKPLVVGSDADLDVLATARRNAKWAGVVDELILQRADVTTMNARLIGDIAKERGWQGEVGGLVLCNPPYGERLDGYDLQATYAELAKLRVGIFGVSATAGVATAAAPQPPGRRRKDGGGGDASEDTAQALSRARPCEPVFSVAGAEPAR